MYLTNRQLSDSTLLGGANRLLWILPDIKGGELGGLSGAERGGVDVLAALPVFGYGTAALLNVSH